MWSTILPATSLPEARSMPSRPGELFTSSTRGPCLLRMRSTPHTARFIARAADTATARAPSRFESIYRNAFINYEQGKDFRIAAPDADAATSPSLATTGPRRRLVVREHGVVRLDYAFFLAEAPEFLAEDPRRFRLESRGEQVPLQIKQLPGNPAVLDAGEWVQFYGQPLDDDPKTVLNTDNGGNEDLYELRDFSDDNVYFLTVANSQQPQMSSRAATPGVLTPPTHFETTARAEVDDEWLPLGGTDPWFWLPYLFEAVPLRTETVPLPGLVRSIAVGVAAEAAAWLAAS